MIAFFAAMTPELDPTRAALALLPRRIGFVVVAVLLAVSLLAWRSTADEALRMSGMAMGLGQLGTRVQGPMSATLFLAMWVTMMTAMMLPTVVPMVLAHLAIVRRRGGGVFATLVFIGGYLLVWSAIGLLPLGAFMIFAELDPAAAQSRWLPALAGAILVVAGAYQFTGWKRVCLDYCQSPFAFVARHDFAGGAASALRAGLAHGAYCLGCCWALMTVLLVVGLMNLAWMIGLFVLFFIEKNWKHGLVMAKVAGALLVGLGVAVAVSPALLELISQ